MNRPNTIQVAVYTLVMAAGLVLFLLDVLPPVGILVIVGAQYLLVGRGGWTVPLTLRPWWRIALPLAALAVVVCAYVYEDRWGEVVPKTARRAVGNTLMVVLFAGMVGNAWWQWWRARQQGDSNGK